VGQVFCFFDAVVGQRQYIQFSVAAEAFNDPDVIEGASDIEQLATNLSQKVWQKITIVQASGTTLSALPSLD
jgi:hypothetical protein